MNSTLSFKKLALLQKELLSKQSPTTLEKARQQIQTREEKKKNAVKKINK